MVHSQEVKQPSSALVRAASDRKVLEVLLASDAVTRASLAAETGLSRPTASAAVSRLMQAGIVVETGENTHGRGRSAHLLTLASVPEGLCVSVEPDGVVAQVITPRGEVVRERSAAADGPLAQTLRELAEQLRAQAPFARAAVSVADPIDRHSGRAVSLPDEPFLVGQFDPVRALEGLACQVDVDNDVNWAAQAYATSPGVSVGQMGPEAARATGRSSTCVAVLYLGHGLGCGIVNDGQLVRGHRGLAGEVAHLVVAGVGGQARAAIEVFDELGLRNDGAIVPARVRAAISHGTGNADEPRSVIAGVVSGLTSALVGLVDPAQIVLAGPWADAVLADVQGQVAASKRPVEVVSAQPDEVSPLVAMRAHVSSALRQEVLARTS